MSDDSFREFILGWLLLVRALSTFDVFFVGLEYDVIIECILIEIFLLARLQIPVDLILRVDGLMMAVYCSADVFLFRFA